MPHIPILRMKSLKTLPFPIAAAAANAGLFALSNLNKLLLRQNLVRNLSMLRGGGEGESPATLTQEISSQDNDPWITVGGGAVNEKKRMYAPDNLEMPQPQHQDAKTSNYDPISVKSHLWHALEGMDRYPNYLARWPEEDIDLLEESLKIQLEKVRQQRSAVVDRRDKMRQLVQDLRATAVASSDDNSWDDLLVPPTSWDDVKSRILDPRMQRAIFTSKMFDESFTPTPPALSDVLNGNVDVQLDIARLTDVMDEELPDVFSLPLLNLTFIKRLRDFIIAISHLGSISKQYQYLLASDRLTSFSCQFPGVSPHWTHAVIIVVMKKSTWAVRCFWLLSFDVSTCFHFARLCLVPRRSADTRVVLSSIQPAARTGTRTNSTPRSRPNNEGKPITLCNRSHVMKMTTRMQ